ncbi:MAG: GntR family transcriptional regulator [Chloroflexi bacterium]|nr:GntR family transcriptional regulator [Chloroflexota bacterium]
MSQSQQTGKSSESKGGQFEQTRVVRASLADQVADQLRNAIVFGEIGPGERLVELEIAQGMGTSQAPVREALQRLEQDGLVTRRSRSATYVTEISMDEMYEIALVRKVVEGIAICYTARCITPEQCDELESLVERMRAAADANDMAMLSTFDLEFHCRICEWSGKETLVRVWTPLYYQMQRFLVNTHPHAFPDLEVVADVHMPIVQALRDNDSGKSVQAIESHVMLLWDENRIDTAVHLKQVLDSIEPAL